MAENINIGGRLHSTATGNIVAGANEILDDNKGTTQSVINTEVDAALANRYTKDETYNKTQLNSMITTPDIDYKYYDTYADMLAETNHPAGAIYRVANYDGEHQEVANMYSEYSWDGTGYKFMAVRNYGIDDEPTVGSDNLVKSWGIYLKINQEKQRAETSEQYLLNRVDSIKEETLEENRQMVNYIMENYAPVKITGDVNNAADEEDLTSVNVEGTDVLKFNNKVYNPIVFSGLGKTYLRKNIQEITDGSESVVKNILTQNMISEPNTIYNIQYDFDLEGESITIPNNCILKFEGGSLKNGNIIFNNTYLEGNIKLLEGNYSGHIINNRVSVEWFGMERNSNIDYSSILQKIVDFSSTGGNSFEIYFPNTYYINNTVYLPAGIKFVGYSGHTFKLGGRLTTSVQTDDFVMFKGKRGSDMTVVRHCIMEGMTFCRNRTAEEKASGLGDGEGYGQAGICFANCTEMDFNDCGFIGFGTCVLSSDIIFFNSTDFAYCNNIIKSSQSGGACSSNFISLSDIWCCGNLTETDFYGLNNIIFSDTWIEYCQTLLKSTLGTKIPSLVFQNCEISNIGYNNPSLLEFVGTVNANTPTIKFDKCTIRCKKQLCISENPATNVYVTLNDCEFLYGGDISLETCNFYGNSKVKSLDNDYVINGKIDYLGLNTIDGEIGRTIKFLRTYGYPEYTNLSAWQIFRDTQNRLAFLDGKSHYCVIPSFIEVEGDTPIYTRDQVNSSLLFVFNKNPNANQPILTFYNFITGTRNTLIENYRSSGTSDQRPSVSRSGVMYFDTTLNKPIWAKRDHYGNVTWVDATGTNV